LTLKKRYTITTRENLARRINNVYMGTVTQQPSFAMDKIKGICAVSIENANLGYFATRPMLLAFVIH
jgi:hypothetical protein